MKESNRSVLLLIDIQQGFTSPYWGRRNNPGFEKSVVHLLANWRERGWPIFHVRHLSRLSESPLARQSPGVEFMEFARPLGSEPVVSKTVNSAFIGTPLENLLRERGFQRLVIAGLTTDHCVSTTVRMASNLGFQTYVAAEATATHDRLGYDGSFFPAETVHQVALASLNGEFAEVATTEVLLKRLLSWDRQALAII